jgi:hypothetical protein
MGERCDEPNPPSPFPEKEGGDTPLSLWQRGWGKGEVRKNERRNKP